MRRKKKGKPETPLARALHDIRSRIISGLFVLVPLGITVFILAFLFNITVGLIIPVTRLLLGPLDDYGPIGGYAVNFLSFTILLVALYFVGLIAANMVGRRLIAMGEAILARIPVVKTVYSASKQVVQALSMHDKSTFRSVALVEFPSPGLKSIGFVTGSIVDEVGQSSYRVFVPTTPNPTTGFFLIVPVERVHLMDMPVEEACKILMSGGIVAPDRLDVSHAAVPVEEGDEVESTKDC